MDCSNVVSLDYIEKVSGLIQKIDHYTTILNKQNKFENLVCSHYMMKEN